MGFFLFVFLALLPVGSYASISFPNAAKDALVEIKMDGVVCDLMYAKNTNFTGKKIYQNANHCFVHKDAIEKLKVAVRFASALGYKIKIADSFRPVEVQQILWDSDPDDNFLSNPANTKVGLGHCRGTSIDLTLLDAKTGKEVPMGTPVDYSGQKAYVQSTDVPREELKNRVLLIGIMSAAGFRAIKTEWWHFNLPDMLNYPVLEGGLEYMPIVKN